MSGVKTAIGSWALGGSSPAVGLVSVANPFNSHTSMFRKKS